MAKKLSFIEAVTPESAPRYTAVFSGNGPVVHVDGYDYPIQMPDMPAESDMVNYGLPKDEQVFRRTALPKRFRSWDEREQRPIVDREWHRRHNGLWYLIEGEPVYLTGTAYFFLNYWYTESGPLPTFRFEAVEFFWIWMDVVRDPQCFGLLDIKCRRIGDTEKALCIMYDEATKYRNAKVGHQNIKDDDAEKNFKRVVNGHKKMVFFFKPVTSGRDDPKGKLDFSFPSRQVTEEYLEAEAQKDGLELNRPELNSVLDYGPSKTTEYDGRRLSIYYADEPGKFQSMDVNELWGVVKPCLTLNSMTKIIGKAIFTTTAEELGNGACLENITKFWGESDQSTGTDVNVTRSGLKRCFRSAVMAAEVNKFGKVDREAALSALKKQRKSYLDSGQLKDLADFSRRFPIDIEDVFKPSSLDCELLPEMLDPQIDWLKSQPEDLHQRFKLAWVDRLRSVEAIPDENGPWYFTQAVENPNSFFMDGDRRIPGNRNKYFIGVDPVDHRNVKGGSNTGIAVFRGYDKLVDGHLQNIHEDIDPLQVRQMKTDQFVAVYNRRSGDPTEMYEDALKACVFFGAKAMVESNKPGVLNHFENNGMGVYLAAQVKELKKGSRRRKPAPEVKGTYAGTESINEYVDKLLLFISRRVHSCYLRPLLDQWRLFKVENRTKYDLAVASGWALVLAYSGYNGRELKNRQQDPVEETIHGVTFYKTFKRAI